MSWIRMTARILKQNWLLDRAKFKRNKERTMKAIRRNNARVVLASILLVLPGTVRGAEEAKDEGRCAIWVDPYRGEPVRYENVIDDLTSVRLVYLGESHALERHHVMQLRILRDLAANGQRLVLGMEQLEHFQQPHLDRYNRGEIDYQELVTATNWPERWENYQQYRKIVETAREFQIPIVALNARAETIRQIARKGGVDQLEAQAREELPEQLQIDDPLYEKLLNLKLMVHMSVTPETLRPVREAQICRDEMMASVICSFLQSKKGQNRTAIVLCGAGHVSYGLGMVSRVRRRLPEAKDRVIVLSQSGDVELSPEARAVTRNIEITHEQLRAINQPIADYLHVKSLAGKTRGGRSRNRECN
ncbi:MAG: ChaN family lipoprotein [Pirellulaceae bacterium]